MVKQKPRAGLDNKLPQLNLQCKSDQRLTFCAWKSHFCHHGTSFALSRTQYSALPWASKWVSKLLISQEIYDVPSTYYKIFCEPSGSIITFLFCKHKERWICHILKPNLECNLPKYPRRWAKENSEASQCTLAGVWATQQWPHPGFGYLRRRQRHVGEKGPHLRQWRAKKQKTGATQSRNGHKAQCQVCQ